MTLDTLKVWFRDDVQEAADVRAGRRVVRMGTLFGRPFVAYLHPSGRSQPRTDAEKAAIRNVVDPQMILQDTVPP